MKRKIGIGVIGYGFMGRTHAYGVRSIPFFYQNLPYIVDLAAVASSQYDNAQKAKEEAGFLHAYGDWRAVIDCPDVDAVTISTPNYLHEQMLLYAIEKGKHIYIDKPLTGHYQEVMPVLKALATKPDLVHQMVFNNRFYPCVMHAKQMIEAGRIGNIISFRGAALHSGSVDQEKPMGWKQRGELSGGGVLLDLGSHILDLAYYLMGEFETISALSHILYPQRPLKGGGMEAVVGDDLFLMTLKTKSGAPGTLEASKVATGCDDGLKLEIHGDRGAIRMDLGQPDYLEYFDLSAPEGSYGGQRGFTSIRTAQRFVMPGGVFPSPKTGIGWVRSHVHCLYCFLNSVYSGQPAVPSIMDGAYVQKVMAAAVLADRSQKTVSIDAVNP